MATPSTDRATRYRGEGRPKRKLSTSPAPPTPKTPTAKPSSAKKSAIKSKDTAVTAAKSSASKRKARTPTPEEEADEEETLQSSLEAGDSIPTLKEPQPRDLPLNLYKSIAESGVLQTALERSRQRWLVDGLFEKYWVKYSRKNKDEPTPSSQSMTKLNGECFMVVEPHSFKVTLFSVKAQAPASLNRASPGASHVPVHAPMGSPFTGVPVSSSANSPRMFSPLSDSMPQPQQASSANRTQSPIVPPAPNTPTLPVSASGQGTVKKEVTSASDDNPHHNPHHAPGNAALAVPAPASQPPRPQNTGGTDPVIQMLAARAATDDELKALMKTVAQGHATQDQLSIFQKHIDELNAIIQAQKRPPTQDPSNPSMPSQAPYHPPQYTSSIPPIQPVPYIPPQYPPSAAGPPKAAMKQGSFSTFYHSSPNPPVKPKLSTSSKPHLSAIVFEFNEASGTRYLLPRNSILEYLPGNTQVLMSFLVVKNGSGATGGKYDASTEYCQPVTLRLVSDNSKLLDQIARVVAPPEEARRDMADRMSRLGLAEDVYLAARLPRAEDDITKVEEPKPVVPVTNELQTHYDAPNSLIPLAAFDE